MSRLSGIVCAVLVFATAGCTLDSLFVSFVGPSRKEQSFSGTRDQTEETLTLALTKLNVRATRRVNGEEIRLLARTPSGKAFALVLQEQKNERGPQTLVGIEWDKEADDQFWLFLAAELVRPARQPQGPAVVIEGPVPTPPQGR